MAKPSRSAALFEFDSELCGQGEIAGADEAGRGCLAGPLVAAAVVFDYSRQGPDGLDASLDGLADSKKLTAAARERLYPLIVRYAERFSVVIVGNGTIDEKGLHVSNLRALGRSLLAAHPCPPIALIDGRQEIPGAAVPHLPVTKGDAKSACIAAASIIAKVTRDRLMRSLHSFYPQYGFDRHVGYATREHLAAIARYGFCSLHRRSFKVGGSQASERTGEA